MFCFYTLCSITQISHIYMYYYIIYILYPILNLNIFVSAGHERLPSVVLKWLRFKNIPNPH